MNDRHRLRISRMHAHVEDAGVLVDVEDLVPGFAAIGRLEKAALRIRAVQPAEGATTRARSMPVAPPG